MNHYKDHYSSYSDKTTNDYRAELLKKALAEKRSIELDNQRSAAQNSSALQALRCYSPETQNSPIPSPSENMRLVHRTSKRQVPNYAARDYPTQNDMFSTLYMNADTEVPHPLRSILKIKKTDGESEMFALNQLPFSMDNIENEDEFLYGETVQEQEPSTKQQPDNAKVKDSSNWSDEDDFPVRQTIPQNRSIASRYADEKPPYFKPSLDSVNKYIGHKETDSTIPKKGLLDGITIDVDLKPDSWDDPAIWDETLSSPKKAVSPVLDIFQEDDDRSTWKYISEWKNSSSQLGQSNNNTSDSTCIAVKKSNEVQCSPINSERVHNVLSRTDPSKAYASNSSVSKTDKTKINPSKADKSRSVSSNSDGWHHVQVLDLDSPKNISLSPTSSSLLHYSKFSKKKRDEALASQKLIKIDSPHIHQHNETDSASSNAHIQSSNLNTSTKELPQNEQRSCLNLANYPTEAANPSKSESDTPRISIKLLPHPVQKLQKLPVPGTESEKIKANIKEEAQSLGKEKQIESIKKFFDSKARDKEGNTNICNLQSIFKFLDQKVEDSSKVVDECSLMQQKQIVYSDSSHPRISNPEQSDFKKIDVIPTRIVRLKPKKGNLPFGGHKKFESKTILSNKFQKRSRSPSPGEHRMKPRYSRERADILESEMYDKRPNALDDVTFKKSIYYGSLSKGIPIRNPKHYEIDQSNRIARGPISKQSKLYYSKDSHSKSLRMESVDTRSPVLHLHERSPPRYSFEMSPYRSHMKSPERYEGSPRRQTHDRSPRRLARDRSPRKLSRDRSPRKYPRGRSPRKHSRDRSPKKYTRGRSPRKYSRDRSPRKYSHRSPRRHSHDRSPTRYSYERSPSRYSDDRSPSRYNKGLRKYRSPSISPEQSSRRSSSDGSRDSYVRSSSPKDEATDKKFQQNSNDKPSQKSTKIDVSQNVPNEGIIAKYDSSIDSQKDQVFSLKVKGKEISVESKGNSKVDSGIANITKAVVSKVPEIDEKIVNIPSDTQPSQPVVAENIPAQPIQLPAAPPPPLPPYSTPYHNFPQPYTQSPYYPSYGQPYNFYQPPYTTEMPRLPIPPSPFDYSSFYSAGNPPNTIEHYPETDAVFAKNEKKINKSPNTRTLTSVPIQKDVNSSSNFSFKSMSLNTDTTQSCISAEKHKEFVFRKADIRKKISYLNSEYSKLCKHQGEHMRKKRRMKDGHKDQIIQDYGNLQDEIKIQLRDLLDEAKTIDKELQKPVADPTLTESVESVSAPTEPIVEKKQEADNSAAVLVEGPSKEVEYYDPGSHWCKICNKLLLTLPAMLEHLHTNDHKQHLDPLDRPWAPESNKTANKKKALKQKELNVSAMKGGQFLMPIEGFYCSLCKQMFGDKVCANDHLLTHEHNQAYEKYTVENPVYERRWILDRLAGLGIMNKEEKKRKADVERLLLNKHKKKEVEKAKTSSIIQVETTNSIKQDEENAISKANEISEFEAKVAEDIKRAQEAAINSESTSQKQERKGIRLVLLDGKNSKIPEKNKEITENKSKQTFVYIGRAPNYKPRATPKLDSKVEDNQRKEADLEKKCKTTDSVTNSVVSGNVLPCEILSDISTVSVTAASVSIASEEALSLPATVCPMSRPSVTSESNISVSATVSLPTVECSMSKTNSNNTSVYSAKEQLYVNNIPQLPNTVTIDSGNYATQPIATVGAEEFHKAKINVSHEASTMATLDVISPTVAFNPRENISVGSDNYVAQNKSDLNIPESNLSVPSTTQSSKAFDFDDASVKSIAKTPSRAQRKIKNPKGRYDSVLVPVLSNTVENSENFNKQISDSISKDKSTQQVAKKALQKPRMKREGPIHGPLTEEEEDFLLLGISKEDMTPLAVPKPPPSSLIRQYPSNSEEVEKSDRCEKQLDSGCEKQLDAANSKLSILTEGNNTIDKMVIKNANATANISTVHVVDKNDNINPIMPNISQQCPFPLISSDRQNILTIPSPTTNILFSIPPPLQMPPPPLTHSSSYQFVPQPIPHSPTTYNINPDIPHIQLQNNNCMPGYTLTNSCSKSHLENLNQGSPYTKSPNSFHIGFSSVTANTTAVIVSPPERDASTNVNIDSDKMINELVAKSTIQCKKEAESDLTSSNVSVSQNTIAPIVSTFGEKLAEIKSANCDQETTVSSLSCLEIFTGVALKKNNMKKTILDSIEIMEVVAVGDQGDQNNSVNIDNEVVIDEKPALDTHKSSHPNTEDIIHIASMEMDDTSLVVNIEDDVKEIIPDLLETMEVVAAEDPEDENNSVNFDNQVAIDETLDLDTYKSFHPNTEVIIHIASKETDETSLVVNVEDDVKEIISDLFETMEVVAAGDQEDENNSVNVDNAVVIDKKLDLVTHKFSHPNTEDIIHIAPKEIDITSLAVNVEGDVKEIIPVLLETMEVVIAGDQEEQNNSVNIDNQIAFDDKLDLTTHKSSHPDTEDIIHIAAKEMGETLLVVNVEEDVKEIIPVLLESVKVVAAGEREVKNIVNQVDIHDDKLDIATRKSSHPDIQDIMHIAPKEMSETSLVVNVEEDMKEINPDLLENIEVVAAGDQEDQKNSVIIDKQIAIDEKPDLVTHKSSHPNIEDAIHIAPKEKDKISIIINTEEDMMEIIPDLLETMEVVTVEDQEVQKYSVNVNNQVAINSKLDLPSQKSSHPCSEDINHIAPKKNDEIAFLVNDQDIVKEIIPDLLETTDMVAAGDQEKENNSVIIYNQVATHNNEIDLTPNVNAHKQASNILENSKSLNIHGDDNLLENIFSSSEAPENPAVPDNAEASCDESTISELKGTVSFVEKKSSACETSHSEEKKNFQGEGKDHDND